MSKHLFISTFLSILISVAWDGTVFELQASKLLSSPQLSDIDLMEVYHLNNIRVSCNELSYFNHCLS